MITCLNTTSSNRVVYSGDPAIDSQMSNPEKYKETLDLQHLAFKGDSKPTYFTLKAVGNSAYRTAVTKAVSGGTGESEAEQSVEFALEFARLGVVKIENLFNEGDSFNFPNGMSKEMFEKLPIMVAMELANHVTKLSDIVKNVEDDKKDEGK